MRKVERKRQKRATVVNRKRKKVCILMQINVINHVKTARKRIKLLWCIIIVISNVRARGANVNDVIVLSQPPRPH
jgi:hypothetical protein